MNAPKIKRQDSYLIIFAFYSRSQTGNLLLQNTLIPSETHWLEDLPFNRYLKQQGIANHHQNKPILSCMELITSLKYVVLIGSVFLSISDLRKMSKIVN